MSTPAAVVFPKTLKLDNEKMHRLRLRLGYALAVVLILGLAVYGFGYYFLDSTQRPFSLKHHLLKPSGSIGLSLGLLGFAIFIVIFLYPLRKRWLWLKRQGTTRHWLDFHVLLGLMAPFVIAFHASFKFRGLAGMAFWIMTAVALSGVVGRYLYGQIPRSLTAAELSLQEARETQEQLTQRLATQNVVPSAELGPLFRLPRAEVVHSEPMALVLCSMVAVDLQREFRIARLRLHTVDLGRALVTLGGLLPSGRPELEQVIGTARRQATLSKRILFLSRSQQVFHLWHVVHRPFSYSFAALAMVHIVVVLLFGLR